MSSLAHFNGRIYWRDLHFEKKDHKYDRIKAYTQSKYVFKIQNYRSVFHKRFSNIYFRLANVMHSRELASRLEGAGITVVSLHPGNLSDVKLTFAALRILRH